MSLFSSAVAGTEGVGVQPPVVACISCGRALGEAEAPAFLTLVDGEPRALCADCLARPDSRRVLAALLGVGGDAVARILDVPAHREAPDTDPLPGDREADAVR